MLRHAATTLCLAALGTAQNPCEGIGVGSAYLSTTPAIVGGNWVMNMGSPASANGIGLLLFGNDARRNLPFCFDVSQLFISLIALLDANGNTQFTFPVGPATFGLGPIFSRAIVLEGSSTWSHSKSVRISIEHPNSTRPLPPMAQGRSLHTATAVESGPRDNRTGVLVAGGALGSMTVPTAIASTEVFDSLTRTWSAGPALAVPRASHRAVRLADGRIMISGGMTNAGAPAVGGPAVASCEIWDPATNTFSPTGSMLQPRAAHGLCLLPDGRVLASGGFASWQDTNSGPGFLAALNTAQDTTELWSPATGSWAVGPTMSSKRAGHTQSLLDDGRVLLVGGCIGGTTILVQHTQLIYVPTFTASCEQFSPSTNGLAPAPSLPIGLGFHGAARLGNGNLLISCGAASVGSYGEAAASNLSQIFDAATSTWSAAPGTQTPVAFHTLTAEPSGGALAIGGYLGNFASLVPSAEMAKRSATGVTPMSNLGINPGLTTTAFANAAHAACLLHDGTTLVTGGYTFFPTALTFNYAGLVIAP